MNFSAPETGSWNSGITIIGRMRAGDKQTGEITISVVVPVYNTGAYLERVIDTLEAQRGDDETVELIFVDNNSRDNSLDILGRHANIRVLREQRQGSYAARNRGIREASGDIIAFTDSDCYPAPGWLEAIRRHFERHPVGQVVMGPRIAPADKRWLQLVSDYENKKSEWVFTSDEPGVYFGYTNNMAVRRSAVLEHGPFLERSRGADSIFVRRLVETLGCQAVAFCPEMSVLHAELDSIPVYYSKIMTYARSRKSYSHVEVIRPLGLNERLRVFREAIRDKSMVASAGLFSILAIGSLAWWLGGLGVQPSDE
jgi:glycosyltransferase involved in cell wall biosynthesis